MWKAIVNDFDETDLEVMMLLANQAGIAIENAVI
jgi:GAF domain-containing protein